jgi:hypothetical protein
MEVEIRNVYKMNYLKAVIGIRRSEGQGDKELGELKKTYGDLMKDLPSEKLRDYQCAFAIFDLDNSKTVEIDEVLDTLQTYGLEHQIADCYSDHMKDLNAGQKKPFVRRMITHAKNIIAKASSRPKLPVTGALQPAHASEDSMNLAEFIVFMEYRTDPRSSLIPKASAAAAAAADDDDDAFKAFKAEFGSFCKSVLSVMLHTSNDLATIYRTLGSTLQKTFRSSHYLGKLCEMICIEDGQVLYERGELRSMVCTACVTRSIRGSSVERFEWPSRVCLCLSPSFHVWPEASHGHDAA